MNNLNNPEIKTHEIQFTPSKFPNFTNHATKKHIKNKILPLLYFQSERALIPFTELQFGFSEP
jgi:hypothetical protein